MQTLRLDLTQFGLEGVAAVDQDFIPVCRQIYALY